MASKMKSQGGFRTIGLRSLYRGRIFELKQIQMRAPDGHKFKHEILFHPGAAVIVPVLKGERFVLVRQFRSATGQVIWEFPAGTLEHGESPLICAKREIIEETGFEAKRWRKLGGFYPAPGVSTEFMHIFLASELIPKKMSPERDEFIERRILPCSKLENMILSGSIVDSKTIIGFYYYCKRRKNLR